MVRALGESRLAGRTARGVESEQRVFAEHLKRDRATGIGQTTRVGNGRRVCDSTLSGLDAQDVQWNGVLKWQARSWCSNSAVARKTE